MNANDKFAMSGVKITESRFGYISSDSWLNLFYQILKIYYLSRISAKQLRTIPNLTDNKNIFPDYYVDGSNVFSERECILIRSIYILLQ